MQTIKTWYKYAPDILGKKLQQRKKLGGVIPEKQRQVISVIGPHCQSTNFQCWQTGHPILALLSGCRARLLQRISPAARELSWLRP